MVAFLMVRESSQPTIVLFADAFVLWQSVMVRAMSNTSSQDVGGFAKPAAESRSRFQYKTYGSTVSGTARTPSCERNGSAPSTKRLWNCSLVNDVNGIG